MSTGPISSPCSSGATAHPEEFPVWEQRGAPEIVSRENAEAGVKDSRPVAKSLQQTCSFLLGAVRTLANTHPMCLRANDSGSPNNRKTVVC